MGKSRSHCNPCNERKEATTENKWATEKMKENKERKPLVNFNMGRGIHRQGWCESKKPKNVEDHVEQACIRGLEVCFRIV